MYETIKSEKIFEGKICSLRIDTVTLPNGKTAKREIVGHKNAAGVVAVDDEGKLLMVKQYRHTVGKEVLEIPAGLLDSDDEKSDVCAARELEEETSYKPGKLTKLFTMYSSIGFCEESLDVFLAENLIKGNFNPDEDEFIEVGHYDVEQLCGMIYSGEITDGKSIAGIMAYKDYIRGNKK